MTVRIKSTSLFMVACSLLLSACASVEPWVKPYERAHLADPIMNFQRNPVSFVLYDPCVPGA